MALNNANTNRVGTLTNTFTGGSVRAIITYVANSYFDAKLIDLDNLVVTPRVADYTFDPDRPKFEDNTVTSSRDQYPQIYISGKWYQSGVCGLTQMSDYAVSTLEERLVSGKIKAFRNGEPVVIGGN